MQKNIFLPTYLPFFSDRYRKQTISFFRPNLYMPVSAQKGLIILFLLSLSPEYLVNSCRGNDETAQLETLPQLNVTGNPA